MSESLIRIETTFSAGEAARITGVPQATQRVWRSRRYLPEIDSGKAQYGLTAVIQMGFMRYLSESGIRMQQVSTLAKLADTRIEAILLKLPGAVRYEGFENGVVPQADIEERPSLYFFAPLPQVDDEVPQGYVFSDLAFLSAQHGRTGAHGGVFVDLGALAKSLLTKSGRHLITLKREASRGTSK